jgi:hypothetical protein
MSIAARVRKKKSKQGSSSLALKMGLLIPFLLWGMEDNN